MSSPSFLDGARGATARWIAERDWSATPLGPPERWPPALRISLGICLRAGTPMFVWWGERLLHLHNDACIPFLGGRHPAALGAPAAEVWAEVWEAAGSEAAAVMERGEAREARVRVPASGGGEAAGANHLWALSPIPGDGGGVGGILGTVREETDPVRAEAELTGARRRLDSALIAGEVGTFEWDVAADRLWGDRNFARLFGIALDASGAAPLDAYLAAIHPDDRERVAGRVRRTVETGADYEVEYRITTPGGDRWVVARGKPERDAEGRVARFPGVVLDVTERKEAELALRESETRYRALFESIDEGFCLIQVLFDPEGRPVDYRFLEGNPAWEEHTGLRDAIGRTAREVLPELEQHWFDIYAEVARTGRPIRFESGSEVMGRWFDVYAFRVEAPEEHRVALLFKETSEKRRVERELRESRERLRAVLENSLDAAYRRDLRTDRYDYLSPVVEQVLGVRAEEMEAMPVAALLERIHPADRDPVSHAIEEGTRLRRGRIEYRFRGDDGEYRWVADHFTVQTDEAGRPAFRTGLVRDAGEQRQAAEALRQLLRDAEDARGEAEAANRAKADFLAAMSHELRTPLNAIGGYVDLLELGIHGPVTGAQHTALSRITANQRHLLTLINDILQFARVEAGQMEFQLQRLNVRGLLQSVEALVAPFAAAKGIAYSVRDGEPVPDLVGDEERVRQIVLNLVANAIKFTPAGGWVLLSCDADGDRVSIRVRDNGPGIAPEKQRAIFDPFVQVDRRLDRPQEGVGLGLAISRDLARAMGGDLGVESAPGSGSTFSLHLPRAPAEG